nr:hypothetical protein [uncultured Mediterranean phage uvMED]
MATHDYVIDNSTGANVRADLNLVLQAILSNNSSGTAPSTTAAYMWWADTSAGILKIRNSADNAWVELLQLDGTLTLEDGSASTPALANRSDLNTGVFFSAADKFNIATGGVERMELGTTTVFNEDGEDVDFRIEGDTVASLFHVDAGNDRVGINTSTPTSTLQVVGKLDVDGSQNANTAEFVGNTTSGQSFGILVDAGTTSADYVANFRRANNDSAFFIRGDGHIGIGTSNCGTPVEIRQTSASHGIVAINRANSDTFCLQFGNDSSHNGLISTNGTDLRVGVDSAGTFNEKFRFKDDGKFGIGDSTPTTALEIHGHNQVTFGSMPETIISYGTTSAYNSGSAGSGINFGGFYNSTPEFTLFAGVHGVKENTTINHYGGALLFSTRTNGGNSAERGRFNSSGNFLLGTTTDLGKLTVSKVQNDLSSAGGFANPHIRLDAPTTTDNTGFTGIAYSVSSLSNYGWTAGAQRVSTGGTDGAFIFRHHSNSATGNERVRISETGQLLLRTTGVGGGSGGVRLQNPDVGSCRFGTTITSGTKTLIQFISNNANNIVGSISVATSTTTYAGTSDYRLKENESLISDGITRLKQLKPYRFNWKTDSSTIVDGFFAHEVSSIVPEAVTGTKDAVAVQEDVDQGISDAIGEPIYQGIDQAKLVPLLTAGLQEAITKIEVLETKVAALEAA